MEKVTKCHFRSGAGSGVGAAKESDELSLRDITGNRKFIQSRITKNTISEHPQIEN